ncbi:hybrid sensor histidine kinase/response regulator [Aestuariispira insulae]|uniref:Sensory/regulatory protein RpfC n=1 Tax=Aestuariispira insulae TaxID=1461337 RepID=A0A3D9HVK3_9PROT|nr:ATP-binding protein [Aestuariispira insulae]RED53522.1 PAS domain S-box-containing protein [Aestuariispira insulae]
MDSLHDLLDVTPHAACLVSASGVLERLNSPARHLFAISSDQVKLSLAEILVKPEQMTVLLKGFAGAKGQSEIVIPMRSVKGREFRCRLTATKGNGIGKDSLLLWFDEQPGKDKTAQAFQEIFTQSDQPQLIVSRADGRILRANDAAKVYFSLSGSRSKPDRIEDYLNPDDWNSLIGIIDHDGSLSQFRAGLIDGKDDSHQSLLTARALSFHDIACVAICFLPQDKGDAGVSAALSEILDSAPMPTLVCDPLNGAILSMSGDLLHLLKIADFSPGNGLMLQQLLVGGDPLQLLQKVVASGSQHDIDTLWRRNDHGQCRAKVSATPFEGRSGTRVMMALTVQEGQDGTAYEDFFDSAPMPMLLASRLDGQVKRLNNRAMELFDPSATLSTKTVRLREYIGSKPARHVLDRIKSHGYVGEFEAQLITVYDEQIDCLLNGRQVLVNGQLMALIYISDITQQKAAENTLKRFFEAAPMPMMSVRVENRQVLQLNKRASELFLSQDDLEGSETFLGQFFGDENALQLMEKVKSGGFVDDLELNFTSVYGESMWVLISIQLLHMEDEDIVLIGMNDITVRKEVEQALSEAKEEAENATNQKSSFLSTMSHEIRTPMNGMLGMIGLMQLMELDDEQQEALDIISDSAKSLLTIIDDILDFSKIEAGKLELESIATDPENVVEGALDIMAGKAREKGVELVAFIATDVPRQITGDPVRLRQVILNLVSNAVKFTAKGIIITRLSRLSGNDEGDADRLRFEVIDQGIGITEKKQKHLFQPFIQAESSTAREFGGSGLGLSICRALVELMGGQIGVVSREGEGATFWFDVPLDGSEEPARISDPILEGLKVLLIQQHEKAQLVLAGQMEAAGAAVVGGGAGEDIDGLVRDLDGQGPFDVAVIDYENHGPDGCEIAVRLSEAGQVSRDRVIITVPSSREAVTQRIKDERFAVRLMKPIRRQKILNSVAEVAGRVLVTETRQVETPKVEPPTREEAIRQGGLILLVDDNEVNRLVIGKQLTHLGYAFDTAVNGVDALEKVGETRYGLILTDIRMPQMDGYELARQIRAQEKETGTARMPMLALTANAMAEEEERCLTAGLDVYLSKPLKLQKLSENLGIWLQRPTPDTEKPSSQERAETLPDGKGGFVDLAVLSEILGLEDEAELVSILEYFAELLPGLMNTLSEALSARDREAIRDAAHAAKGACRNAGASRLAEILEQIEKGAPDLGEERLDALWQDAQNDAEGTLAQIRQMAEDSK